MCQIMGIAFSGPLGGAAEGVACYLARLGYAPLSIALRLRLLAHLSRWLLSEGLVPGALDSAAIERFLIERKQSHVDLSTPGALAPLLAYLRSEELIPAAGPAEDPEPGPVDLALGAWGLYLSQERGLQANTVRYYQELARPFLTARQRGDGLDLDGLDARAVSEFLVAHVPAMTPQSGKLMVTSLRSLLLYLFTMGLISDRLDVVVPARAGYRDTGLPRGLAPDQVDALVAAAGLPLRTGLRNRAIVLLISRLGLRASEVAALTLDDIDWRAGTVRVQGKGGQIDLMPLPSDAGAALAAHLRQARHPGLQDRALFHRSLAPYQPLSQSGVMGVVRVAGKRAGFGTIGTHRLRHAVAAATVNAGASLEEVGQLLRHRSLESTTIYAKVDLVRLVSLARPWPGTQDGMQGGEAR